MFRSKTKTRKSGPLKALQSVLGGDDNNNMGAHQSKTWSGKKSGKPGHKHNQQQHSRVSKDDLSMAHSQTKEKVKANPYATIKMWRPISMSASSVDGAPDDDVYQTYTNFDALRLNLESDPDPTRGRLPATGDLRNEEQLPPHRRSHAMESGQNPGRVPQMRYAERADWASRNGTGKTQTSSVNGFVEIPADYSRDNSPAPVTRRVSFRDEDPSNKPPVTNGRSNEVSSHNPTKSSRPPPLPSSPPPIPSSQPPSSPPPLPSSPPPTSPSSKHNTSFQVVSDGATNSIKLVLSHSYADADLAGKDVERLLAELKLTMDSLQSSRIDKNPSQLSMCLSELHSQTKQFINDAKLVVSSANNSQEKMLVQLEYAVHTLARLFLHGQATMLMMTSSHQAQNLGFQLIKAANSFKSTVGAANAAVGKALNDPHMKYLMRQATNLASLLGSLINSIKEIQAN